MTRHGFYDIGFEKLVNRITLLFYNETEKRGTTAHEKPTDIYYCSVWNNT